MTSPPDLSRRITILPHTRTHARTQNRDGGHRPPPPRQQRWGGHTDEGDISRSDDPTSVLAWPAAASADDGVTAGEGEEGEGERQIGEGAGGGNDLPPCNKTALALA